MIIRHIIIKLYTHAGNFWKATLVKLYYDRGEKDEREELIDWEDVLRVL
jgi:hypothetical protein